MKSVMRTEIWEFCKQQTSKTDPSLIQEAAQIVLKMAWSI